MARTPPHNDEAERAVLGVVLMTKGRMMGHVVKAITPDDFFSPRNAAIFLAMGHLYEAGSVIDHVTVGNRLNEVGKLGFVKGIYLSELTDGVVTTVHIDDHVRLVKSYSARRAAIQAAQELIERGHDLSVDTEEYLDGFRKTTDTCVGLLKNGRTALLSDGIPRALAEMARYSAGDYNDRVPTGINGIDLAIHGGFGARQLIILGAPSGGGKTTFIQQLSVRCARHRGPVLVASPEMSLNELAQREIIKQSGHPLQARAPWVRRDSAERMAAEKAHEEAARVISREELPIHIMDETDISMGDIADEAASISGLRLVVVDYAQEVAGAGASESRYLQVGNVMRESIALAKRLAVPVLVTSQVNTVKDSKGNITYTYRESPGIIEQKAYTAMIMEVVWVDAADGGRKVVESARIFAKKNRGGYLFDVPIDYRPELLTISDKSYSATRWEPSGDRASEGGYSPY